MRPETLALKESRHGSSRKLSEFEELTVLQTLLTSPGTFLHEVQSELFETTGMWIDCSTICCYACRWGMSRQKMTNVALQRSDVKHAEFIAEMMQFNTDMFVFVDETGSDRRNSIRKFGYGLKGIPPVSYVFLARGYLLLGSYLLMEWKMHTIQKAQ